MWKIEYFNVDNWVSAKKRKIDLINELKFNYKTNKRKYDSPEILRNERIKKKQKFSEYWDKKVQFIDKYDFLIISSLTNSIHRYIIWKY